MKSLLTRHAGSLQRTGLRLRVSENKNKRVVISREPPPIGRGVWTQSTEGRNKFLSKSDLDSIRPDCIPGVLVKGRFLCGTTLHPNRSVVTILWILLIAGAQPAPGQLSATPPMGWNSWNHYGIHYTDQDVRQTADAMASNG